MTKNEALALLRKHKLVAILRGVPLEKTLDVAAALYEGGVRALEFTFDHADPDCLTRNASRVRRVTNALGDRLLVGCGTVLTPQEVEAGADAGARLMISPNLDEAVIRRTRELEAISMPGALTPTEIAAAYKAGADMVKLFPAGVLGVSYIKAVRAPLGFIPMSAVGGVKPENVADFLDAGVCGFGVGGELAKKAMIEAGDMAAITARAREFVAAIEAWEAKQG